VGVERFQGGTMKKPFAGQGTMEYLVIFAIVVGAFILFANGALKAKVKSSFTTLIKGIQSKL
jgi:hypothetical protein